MKGKYDPTVYYNYFVLVNFVLYAPIGDIPDSM